MKTPLTPNRDVAEIVIVAAHGRLIERGHDGAPVLTVPRARSAVGEDGNGVSHFMRDGLAMAARVGLRDGQIEADNLWSRALAMPAELDLAGTAAAQIEANGGAFNTV